VGNGGWGSLAALAEPRRRAVFEFAAGQDAAVTRDDVAAALGMSRPLAAHHLDRLAEAGLLAVTFARTGGRRGPGAGRPAKHYAAVDTETAISVPPRRYDVAARIFARALVADGEPREAVLGVAADEGRARGVEHAFPGAAATLGAAAAVLGHLGYEPVAGDGCVRLRNCPFHGVLDVARELMCTANHAFVEGVLEGLGGADGVTAVLEPPPGPGCCVELRRTGP
jgi:predicted ArsR family transcriptional regulator